MTKAELDLLEKVFARKIVGVPFQSKSKLAQKLERDGYIMKTKKVFGRDRFGEIAVEGYVTTLLGNMTYCQSDRCE
jgi:hypothetical protein